MPVPTRLVTAKLAQESKGIVHPDSWKLGTKSGMNDARDFWNFTDIEVVPRRESGSGISCSASGQTSNALADPGIIQL